MEHKYYELSVLLKNRELEETAQKAFVEQQLQQYQAESATYKHQIHSLTTALELSQTQVRKILFN